MDSFDALSTTSLEVVMRGIINVNQTDNEEILKHAALFARIFSIRQNLGLFEELAKAINDSVVTKGKCFHILPQV